jgi:arylsulfatase A-like enzyme
LASLPERLSAAGYTTLLVYGNHFYGHSGLSSDGFDVIYDSGSVTGHLLNAAASGLLRLVAQRPIFLLVHYMDVHQYQIWAEPPTAQRDPAWNNEHYAARVVDADRALGELLGLWSQRPRAGDSMIAFFSDHGEDLREGNHGSSMSDSLLHVPLVVHFPERADLAGVVVNTEVGLMDLYQTTLGVAGEPISGGADGGVSLLVTTRGGTPASRSLFADYQLYGANLSSIRQGPIQLVVDMDRGTEVLEGLLVDQQSDGTVREGEVKRQLFDRFLAYVAQSNRDAGALSSEQEVDQAALERQLRSMGYIR